MLGRALSHIVTALILGLTVIAAAAQSRGPVDLGTITIPKDFDHRTSVLLKGEYGLALNRDGLTLVKRNWRDGLEMAFGIDTRVEDSPTEAPQPLVEIAEITSNGRPHVRIHVVSGKKTFSALLRVSEDGGPRPPFKGALDPAIQREIALLREAHNLLGLYAGQIWPGWTAYDGLEFVVTFPNRTVLILSGNARVPQALESLPVPAIGSKRAYIDTTRTIPGRIAGITGIGANGGVTGVAAALSGPMAEAGSDAAKPGAPIVMAGRAQPGTSVGRPEAGGASDLGRLLTYVHEAFHCLQGDYSIQLEKAKLRKNRGRMMGSFDVTVDYALYAEVEGKALLNALAASDPSAARQYLTDSLLARELKQKAMPAGAVAADQVRTRDEGTATYANLRAAMLAKERGRPRAAAADAAVLDAAYRGLGAYIEERSIGAMTRVASDMQATSERYYIYGAYQAMVFDRLFPGWKAGLFENDRTLDDVLAERLALTAGDRERAASRFASVYRIDEIRARYDAAVRAREAAIAGVRNRQGRTYRVDVSQAQRSFDIRPREGALFVGGEQLYPRGLQGLDWGSMRLVSVDTPMRFIGNIVEWVDTEAAGDEKGYDLQYEEQVGDLFKKVTLKTKGFSFTANAVRLVDDGKTVTFFIVN